MSKKVILVTGGQRSGKSGYAQRLALSLSPNPVYLATSRIWDEEFRKRVERHQRDRGPEWTNIEEEKYLSRHDLTDRVVVIDCVTLWGTNFFFDNQSDVELSLSLLKAEFDKLSRQDAYLIFVTNELGMGGVPIDEVQRKFTDMQGWLNQYIASKADKIDNLTKPKGSLGTLEALALQVGLIQQTLSPVLRHPVNVIYASDHGIADEGVSKSPKEVTRQVIHNFLNGGAGVCYLARQHGFELKIVDGGVDFDFPVIPQLIDRKVRKGGTRNFLHEAAMTVEEMEKALQYGADIVTDCYNEGCNVISFGEMGIGNTAASSMWMTCLTQIPLIDCVGAGSGLDSEGVRHKYNVLKRSLENYKGDGSALDVMRYFGGYEMVMAVGGMLRAAELKMIILVDGFIMTNCVLVASRLYPEMQSYCVFGHCGDEAGHKRILDFLGAKALLDLGLRLGEGSGSVCAYPILDSAVRMINEMYSFKQAAITKYF